MEIIRHRDLWSPSARLHGRGSEVHFEHRTHQPIFSDGSYLSAYQNLLVFEKPKDPKFRSQLRIRRLVIFILTPMMNHGFGISCWYRRQ